MIDVESYPLEYIHHCGRASFYISCKPISGEVFYHDDCILPDGSRMYKGDEILCMYCGEYLELDTNNIRKRV